MEPINIAGLIGGIISLIVAIVGGIFALVTKKVRSPADDREDRKLVIEGDKVRAEVGTSLLQQMQTMMNGQAAAHKVEMDALRTAHNTAIDQLRLDFKEEISDVRRQLEEMHRERPLLIQIIHAVARIARKYGGADAEAELMKITPPAKDVDLLRG